MPNASTKGYTKDGTYLDSGPQKDWRCASNAVAIAKAKDLSHIRYTLGVLSAIGPLSSSNIVGQRATLRTGSTSRLETSTSTKQKKPMLVCSDLDTDGELIVDSLAKSLRSHADTVTACWYLGAV